jgi:long-chain fatty acid transport protein
MTLHRLVRALAPALWLLSTQAAATNGMNLEGYGPVASSLGGASMAYDNNLAGMMNNPATLALMPEGRHTGLALRLLGPDVEAKAGPYSARSGGTAYYMPAFGWVNKQGGLLYGMGLFAQGGMGTEYDDDSFLSLGTGQEVRSELGVGRLLFPVAWQVNPEFTIGGSLDLVWAMLDLKMAASAADIAGMTGGTFDIGQFGANVAHIDFSDDGRFSGKAKSLGWAAKVGFTWRLNALLTLGGTYHSPTNLGDMETSENGADMRLYDVSATGANARGADRGKMTVIDFQWPETYALGMALRATPDILLVADVKYLGWEDVMRDFRMRYSGGLGSVGFTLPQRWEDQTVLQLGAQYRVNDTLMLRAGFNHADNPIPSQWLNPLFPAIVEDHYSLGASYRIGKASGIAASLVYSPETKQTAASGVTASHAQTNFVVSYGFSY